MQCAGKFYIKAIHIYKIKIFCPNYYYFFSILYFTNYNLPYILFYILIKNRNQTHDILQLVKHKKEYKWNRRFPFTHIIVNCCENINLYKREKKNQHGLSVCLCSMSTGRAANNPLYAKTVTTFPLCCHHYAMLNSTTLNPPYGPLINGPVTDMSQLRH